ncbi:MAG: hypothetical protein IKR85_10595 [Clostridia bacterium]|nr:hypothetical protein [Clostridia bacterium]
MKKWLILALALVMCLMSVSAFADGELFKLGENELTLMGGAVIEDGALKLPGGASHEGGYAVLPEKLIGEVTDSMSLSTWVYIPEDAKVNTYLFSFANGGAWPAVFACVTPQGNLALNIDYRGNLCTEALVPAGVWTYITLSISTQEIDLYIAGELKASYNAVSHEEVNCYWCVTNGGTADTTFFGNLNKIDAVEGLIGTVTWVNGYDQLGDATAMFADYVLYAKALTADEAAALYAGAKVPAAAWPIGAAAVEGQEDGKAKDASIPEDGLRLSVSFADDEIETVGNAQIKDGKLILNGGAWREGGHALLPENALLMCGNEMTLSMFVNIEPAPEGRSFLFAFSNRDSWPGLYSFVDVDGLVHFNVDYRGEMIPQKAIEFGKWNHLTFVASTTEVSVYVNGELLGAYYCPYDTKDAEWEFLNSWTDWTYFGYVEKTGLRTGRIGSGYLSLGDQSGIDMKGEIDELRLYSKALNAEQVKALFETENAAAGYVD